MLKRNTKKQILAAVLSAAFCVCGYGMAGAYTYTGVTSTVDQPTYDSTDLVITGNSSITSNNAVYPKIQETKTYQGIKSGNIKIASGAQLLYDKLKDAEHVVCTADTITIKPGVTSSELELVNDVLNESFNSSLDFYVTFKLKDDGSVGMYYDGKDVTSDLLNKGTMYGSYLNDGGVAFNHTVYRVDSSANIETTITGDAAITVSNNSKLIGKSNVQTSKGITVTGNSLLSAVDTITGGTITTDGDIVANSGDADSGDTIRAKKIISNGLLKSSNGAIAARNGSISAGYIQAAGGVYGDSSITAKGKVKGKSLNIAKMKVSSANITGALTFSGNTVFNGGASANSKKVSSVAKGTANMDLINLGQMNTAFAGAGKTYTAGGNIAIASSNNAISVIKNGSIKSGDTGILTGGTVFNIISALESAVNQQTTRLTNLTTSIKDKDASFTSVNDSVNSLQNNVTSAVTSLDKKAQNYLAQGFKNITDDGKRQLNAMITTSIKNYQNNLASSVSATSAQTENKAGIATMEAKDIPSVSASNNGASKDISAGQIAQGKSGTVTGGEIYEALDTKMDKASLDTALDQKVSIPDYAPVKDMVKQNQEDIKDLKDSKADLSSFNTSLEGKVDKSDFDTVSSQVMVNKEDITSLISSKLNADGSNLDSDVYSTKLANGILEKQNTGLVTGGMVYDALALKADTSYVDAMNDGLTKTLQDTALSLNKDMNKMAAGAAALAGLHPQDYNESCKVDFAAGYGHYKDANAVAVGLFYRPSPITTISLSGTVGNGSPMVNAGLSFKIGYGKQVEKTVVSKAEYEALQNQVKNLTQMIYRLQ